MCKSEIKEIRKIDQFDDIEGDIIRIDTPKKEPDSQLIGPEEEEDDLNPIQ